MAPKNYYSDDAPLFMDEMYKAGAIEEKVFSLHVTDYMDGDNNGEGSKLLIGGYDLDEYAKKGEQVTWNSLVNTYYWAVTLTSVSVKPPKDSTYNLQTESTMAIVDSGTSYLLMPEKDFNNLLKYLSSSNGMNFRPLSSNGMINYAACSYEEYLLLPDLEVQLNSYVYTMPRSSYILYEANVCYMLIMAKDFGTQTSWIADSTGYR